MYNQYTYQTMSTINRHMDRLSDTVKDINNAFTPGYKRKETNFHETLEGAKAYHRRHHTNGVAKQTGRELDFAIQGKGFFEVELPDGTNAYTRDGSFTVGPNGELLSAQGYPIITSHPNSEFVAQDYDAISQGKPESFDVGIGSSATFIPIGSSINLEENGTLRTREGQALGKLNVVTFTNEDGLVDIGDGLFIATEQSGDIREAEIGSYLGQTQIKQAHLEQSNVSIVKNMSDMVQLNTAIKAEMKIIKVLDQMQENMTSTLTRNL